MSRTNKTGRNKGESRHVRVYHWLMQTVAWRSLDATARAIYIEIAARYGGPGSNNGRIPYSVREAAESLRIGKTTAARALERLQRRSFIIPMKKGAFSWKLRHSTEWRLTEFPCDVITDHAITLSKSLRVPPIATGNIATRQMSQMCHGCTIEPEKLQLGQH